MLEIDEGLKKIDIEIKKYLASGGSLSDPNLPFDKLIKTYVFNHNRTKQKLLKTDPENPICKQVYSKDEVLIALGYTPVVKHKPLTIIRCIEEVLSYVNAGGKMDKKVKEYPFYPTIKKFIESENKKGIKVTYNYIMSLCGLYTSEFIEVHQVLDRNVDEFGCLDSIRKNPKDYNFIRSKATTFGCSPAEYVSLFSDYHFSKAIVPVSNYIQTLKEDIFKSVNGYDATGLRETNLQLYLKVKHLREYFPEGSLSSIEETFNALGFDYNGVKKPIKPVNEKYLMKKLEAMYPDKVIDKFDHKSDMGKALLRLSLQKNMFLVDYLKENGFDYTASKSAKRLSQTGVTDKMEILKQIMEKIAVDYNQKKMGLKYECLVRVLKSGKKIVGSPVVSSDCVIYMPHRLELDDSIKEVAHEALETFRGKHM